MPAAYFLKELVEKASSIVPVVGIVRGGRVRDWNSVWIFPLREIVPTIIYILMPFFEMIASIDEMRYISI